LQLALLGNVGTCDEAAAGLEGAGPEELAASISLRDGVIERWGRVSRADARDPLRLSAACLLASMSPQDEEAEAEAEEEEEEAKGE
jgi:hypothetical protein